MASVFWVAHGILFIDCLQKGKTIYSDHYMAFLVRLRAKFKKKRPPIQKKKVLFHRDNVPCHKSMKKMVKLNEVSFELLPHLPNLQIWRPPTTGSLLTWKKCFRERDLAPMKKWLPKLIPILRAKTNHSTKKASKS